MPIFAFKNGVSVLAENLLNELLALMEFVVIYTGVQVDAKTGAGVTENSIADFTFAARFTATGVSEMSRVELNLDRDGEGADLVVQIRSNDFNPDGSNDGTVLKQVVVPKEFVPDPAGWLSVAIDLTGLTAGQNYWLIILRAGDATNKVDWVGEASQDGSYPAYRRSGESGAWSANNALHFRVFSGTSGLPMHVIEGENAVTGVEYVSGLPSKLCSYIPPSDGPAGGVRDVLEISYIGGLPVRGV